MVQAFLYGSYFGTTDPDLTQRTIDFDGTVVVLTKIGENVTLSAARADVTGQVAAKVGGGGGITDFAVNSDPAGLDGVGLVVVFSNPGLPDSTIAVMDGAQQSAGDSFVFNFASPLDKTIAGFSATMSLGIGWGFQADIGGLGSPICGDLSPQFSTVDVNGARMTSCAGNYDDGFGLDGGLITVGGVGDSTNNPANPLQEAGDGTTPRGEDDELYNLEPFLGQNDTQMVVATSNPSDDDIIFLAVIGITAEATVSAEICNDGIDNDGDGLVDGDDPDCQLPPPTTNVHYIYPVKITCVPHFGPASPALMPAKYRTAVNVHNPWDMPANIEKWVTLSPPQGNPSIMSEHVTEVLNPWWAFDVDCKHMKNDFIWPTTAELKVPGGKGFMVIKSDKELDVVAIYTSRAEGGTTSTGVGTSIDVEYIKPHKRTEMPSVALPDLTVKIAPNNESIIENCPTASTCEFDVPFRISNIGPVAAGPFDLLLDADPSYSTVISYGGLAAGADINDTFRFGPGASCHDPDCTTSAKVDNSNTVPESDETNNGDTYTDQG